MPIFHHHPPVSIASRQSSSYRDIMTSMDHREAHSRQRFRSNLSTASTFISSTISSNESTKKPVLPSSMVSFIAPYLQLMTGQPQSCASSGANPSGSRNL